MIMTWWNMIAGHEIGHFLNFKKKLNIDLVKKRKFYKLYLAPLPGVFDRLRITNKALLYPKRVSS